MTPEHATGFLAAIGKGEIYLPTYKGRSDEPEPAQVAELAALNWAVEHGLRLDAIALTGNIPQEAHDGTRLTLEAELPGARLSIRMHARDFLVQGNCGVVAEGGGEMTLRWCLDEVIAQPETAAH